MCVRILATQLAQDACVIECKFLIVCVLFIPSIYVSRLYCRIVGRAACLASDFRKCQPRMMAVAAAAIGSCQVRYLQRQLASMHHICNHATHCDCLRLLCRDHHEMLSTRNSNWLYHSCDCALRHRFRLHHRLARHRHEMDENAMLYIIHTARIMLEIVFQNASVACSSRVEYERRRESSLEWWFLVSRRFRFCRRVFDKVPNHLTITQ